MREIIQGAPVMLALLICGMQVLADAEGARAYRAGGQRVKPDPDGMIVCEAEEFHVEAATASGTPAGWRAAAWGENYYAATFANTFLSRKAFLGAPAVCEQTTATIEVDVPQAGNYLVLARYEAAYRFETQFSIRIEQDGKPVFDRLYGARDNVKIWAFGQKLKTELAWGWGAVENVVWEGHDARATLKPGPARIVLTAGRQPDPQGKRNVDVVVLTTDEEQVRTRLGKESYLPLDGMLTQAGDVWARVKSRGSTGVRVTFPPCTQHSPYWVHLRNWQAVTVATEGGAESQWTDVGGVLDTLNDGQWTLKMEPLTAGAPVDCIIEFGVRTASGEIEKTGEYECRSPSLDLVYDADTRYTKRVGRAEQVLPDLLGWLKAQPVRGKLPKLTSLFAYTFSARPGDAPYGKALSEFTEMFGLSVSSGDSPAYIDVRGVKTEGLEEHCRSMGERAKSIVSVSLGDEIGLPVPPAADHEGFRTWLKGRKLTPSDVDETAGDDWSKVVYDPKASQPGALYWSKRYAHGFGIAAIRERTEIIRKCLPNAGIGANFSPHHGGYVHAYLGEVYKWVSCFRQGGMTMPWSEDYIWQIPVGTPQMNFMNLDLFRAGVRHRPDARIHYYVMPHWPGNTPRMWRRQFYGDIAHGMKIVNLFEFRPVQAAYTENHVSSPDMYLAVRTAFRELGLFEDIVQAGGVRDGVAGLWFSEAGDIWKDNEGSFAAAKRAMYIAIRHSQASLDVVVEEDALDGTLKDYRVLYLTDAHVSRQASAAIAKWVLDGGTLFATAGAGMWNELNRPNAVLRDLFGVEQVSLSDPEQGRVAYIKQDIPFAPDSDTVTWRSSAGEIRIAAVGATARVALKGAEAVASFVDGSPAVATRAAGKGSTIYCAFLPSLSYFKPAIPMRPVDRGSTDDAMSHFIPTAFSEAAGRLIALPLEGIELPVVCSQPLVETTVLESKQGTVIPMVNWSGSPVERLTVTVAGRLPTREVTLAGGSKVEMTRVDGKTVFTLDLDVADALILR